MPRLSKIGAAALAAFGWTSGNAGVTATYLVVAGGGGGSGSGGGGGGGAGGYQTGTTSLNPTLSYTVNVGAGGAAGTVGVQGSNSQLGTLTASVGGGYGGQSAGGNGGSGGGSGSSSGALSGGTATSGQGNNGGGTPGFGSPNFPAGGGGGAGAAGSAATSGQGGAGGVGLSNSISGTAVYYAGGGGGGAAASNAGAGGNGGGGAGSTGTGTAGTANLGGGGGGGNSTAGAGGSGVVIISYVGAQQFGGGNVTNDGTNTIHTFTTSGTLSPLSSLTAQYLVVAGGGGGGSAYNGTVGGGGAGGLLTGTGVTIDTNSNYVVTVGAGGAGGTAGNPGPGVAGSNSSWSIVSTAAVGGGYGGDRNGNGSVGGSGGGSGIQSGPGAAGTSGQGNAGGQGVDYPTPIGRIGMSGGGGGASAAGTNGTLVGGGAGGAGTASSISGTSTYYAGGGGGGAYGVNFTTTGGTGGGGAGGKKDGGTVAATAGTANTGGGGGAGGTTAAADTMAGAAGGSGIVIISYPGSTQQMAGGTVTISGGNVIHTFTSSGYLTPIKYASRSLRLRSSASAYLNRTNSTPTSGSTFTVSFWVKRGTLGANQTLMSGTRPGNFDRIYFSSSDTLIYQWNDGSSNLLYLETTQLFRDPSAWYHIVVVTNTTQATSSNRAAIYINGVQVTAFSTATYPSQNTTSYLNASGVAVNLGRTVTGTFYYDGYLTEVNFIDGAALTPSSFGTFNSYGVWQPITYGGSYGTNGFYLTFGNNTSTTTLGYDTSPAGNNWTTNNISLTAGATYDSMLDVPTLTSATVANYATGNPIYADSSGSVTYTNGNLTWNCPNGGSGKATISATTGKFYWEAVYLTNAFILGVADAASVGRYNNSILYQSDGTKGINGTFTSYGATYTTGDIIGIALDLTGGTVTFYKNNSSQGSISLSLASITNATAIVIGGGGFSNTGNINFGQQPFTYTPPSGFVALNTYNLSTPTIPNGAVYFAATTYTGTGASLTVANTVNGTNFQPDWVWIKSRSAATDHILMDSVRGVTLALFSNLTNAEVTDATRLTSFNSNGFTLGTSASTNTNAATYVGWQWKANAGTNVSNTSGSITSTVSANTTAGFSVVTYTGTGANATVGHGLGAAPSFIIAKSRSFAGAQWSVYSSVLGASAFINLDSTAAVTTGNATVWQGVTPTSTVFSVSTSSQTNGSAATYVAYCFTPVAGYSAFGSYTGNGSTDGPFVFTGFRPRFIMVKCSSAVGGWDIFDTSRNQYNVENAWLAAQSSAAESTSTLSLDGLSNGFKLRQTDQDINGSGQTYIYMAFAENPFKYSLAR